MGATREFLRLFDLRTATANTQQVNTVMVLTQIKKIPRLESTGSPASSFETAAFVVEGAVFKAGGSRVTSAITFASEAETRALVAGPKETGAVAEADAPVEPPVLDEELLSASGAFPEDAGSDVVTTDDTELLPVAAADDTEPLPVAADSAEAYPAVCDW